MLFLKTCLLVTLDNSIYYNYYVFVNWNTGAFVLLRFIKQTNKKKGKKKIYSLHSSVEIKHAGQNRGRTSRVPQQPRLTTEHSCSDSPARVTSRRLGIHTGA